MKRNIILELFNININFYVNRYYFIYLFINKIYIYINIQNVIHTLLLIIISIMLSFSFFYYYYPLFFLEIICFILYI